MKADTVSKLNGVGVLLRFILPLMVGILLLMAGELRGNITQMRDEVKELRIALSNHLQHDVARICNRLERIEEKLGIPPR
jgi:hypothetical protein